MQPRPPPDKPRPLGGKAVNRRAVGSAVAQKEAARKAAAEVRAMEEKLARMEEEHRRADLKALADWQASNKTQTARLVLPWQQPAHQVVVDARAKARQTLGIDKGHEEAERLRREGWPARRIRPATAPPANARSTTQKLDAVAEKGTQEETGTDAANQCNRAAADPKGPTGLPGFSWREVQSVYGARVPPAVLGRRERAQTARPSPRTEWWTASPGGCPRPHTAQAGSRSLRAETRSPRVKSAGAIRLTPDSVVTPLVIQQNRRPFSAAPVMMRGPEQTSSLTPRSFVTARAESRASAGRSEIDRRSLAEILKEDGNEAFRAGDHRRAVALYTEALTEDPTNHAVFSNRSAAHRNLGEFECALTDANRCIAIDAQFANGHVRKGQALEAMGQWREAVEAYRAGLSFHPDNKTLKFAVRRAEELKGNKARRTEVLNEHGHEPPRGNEQDGSVIAMMTGANVGADIVDKLIALFKRADRNGDGLLTRAELILSLRKDGELTKQLGLPANIRDQHRKQFENAFQSIAQSCPNTISMEEFVTHFIGPIQSAKVSAAAAVKHNAEVAQVNTLRAMFNQIDTDGNGTLDRDEIEQMAQILGMRFNKAQMDAAWAFMDRDGSGEVDFNEFKKWHDILTGNADEASAKKHALFLQDRDLISDGGARMANDGAAANNLVQRLWQLDGLGSVKTPIQRTNSSAAAGLASIQAGLLTGPSTTNPANPQKFTRTADTNMEIHDDKEDEIEAAAKERNKEAEQNERDAGFVSSRTATVRGAIASLGNMAIAEDMDFSKMFEAIDTDHNGYIDKMELRAVLWVLWPQAADDKIIDTLYDLIDEDGSGKILEDEFVSQMTRLTHEVQQEKQKARDARREAAVAKKLQQRRSRRYFQKPVFSYRERDIDRRWHALLRERKFGFPVPEPDDPVARMKAEDERREALRIRKMFFELDKDGSGAIEKEELAMLGEHLFGEIMTPAQLDLAMSEMDPDGSGEISFEEFHAWFLSEGEFRRKAMEEERNSKRVKLRTIFDDVDTDGGGSIDKDEVKRLARTLFGADLTPLELKRAMKEMDPDGSGEVDFNEFCEWYFGDGPFRRKVEEEQKRREAEWLKVAEAEKAEDDRLNKLAWLRGMFNSVDKDGSGAIEASEVAELVALIFGTKMGPRQLEECMADMDPDGSGEVDFGEFSEWCNREVPKDRLDDMYSWKLVQNQILVASAGRLNYAMSRLLRMWFNEADADGGGTLEGKEIAKLASMLLGRELNAAEAETLMEQMDPVMICEVCDGRGRLNDWFCTECDGKGKTGGDGEVDFFEFERWYFNLTEKDMKGSSS